ncbi:MAG: tRNA (adenosine(37)-N6)-dimethylallyltransferase MiaA [Ruminococcus sp.]|nr:tRNA (adenosine(37)-N6)-dimethylallyltransferase MiaA [Ruminococcus sp.]
MEKPFVLAVAGPTASGKTWLGVELAKKYGGEVVSADSMQIYKGMDIASAKPTEEEMQGIPHHLIDILDRGVSFSAADYVRLAKEAIEDILSRGRLPIIVGGTGLYIDSLLRNVHFSPVGSDPEYRSRLYERIRTEGNGAVYRELEQLDPAAAEKIHMNNIVRLVRAMEVIHVSGRPFSELKAESLREASPYDSLIIGLNAADRSLLYDRIDQRVDEMVQRGLVEEARQLWKSGELDRYGTVSCGEVRTSANAIGCKELVPYFEGTASLGDCIASIKQETRHYAKRQLTWFKRNEYIRWVIIGDFSKKNEILEKSVNAIEIYKNM